jgi:UDP-N-acetylglucosamine transferase subunit ALG13
MIFVTVGTSEVPFDRLLRASWGLAEHDELVVQHGSSALRPPGATCIDFLSYSRLVSLTQAARVVVSHAGVGSVLTAVRAGKQPLVMPRRSCHGEAVDDHQVEFATHLDASGIARLVEGADTLRSLAAGRSGELSLLGSGGDLASDLRGYLTSTIGPPGSLDSSAVYSSRRRSTPRASA